MKMRLQQAFFNSSQGPQHREIGFPISTDNASWGVGPNTENFEKKFYRQCKLGCGPQHREFRKEILQAMQVGVWAPTQRISKRNSTGNASWGVGPNTENFEKKFYRQCELGCGPQHRSLRKVSLQ
ncbi:Nitrogen regulation protein NIFR3 [Staphylococcus aureus]|nr:Nitrogen regulation protein NIFR3 [Staphylococcus aureus]